MEVQIKLRWSVNHKHERSTSRKLHQRIYTLRKVKNLSRWPPHGHSTYSHNIGPKTLSECMKPQIIPSTHT
jgi:hypothetical protein